MLWLKKKKKNLFKWDYDLGRFSGQKCHTKNPNPLENTCYLWTLSFFLCGLNLLNSRQSCLQWERQKAWERERERETRFFETQSHRNKKKLKNKRGFIGRVGGVKTTRVRGVKTTHADIVKSSNSGFYYPLD